MQPSIPKGKGKMLSQNGGSSSSSSSSSSQSTRQDLAEILISGTNEELDSIYEKSRSFGSNIKNFFDLLDEFVYLDGRVLERLSEYSIESDYLIAFKEKLETVMLTYGREPSILQTIGKVERTLELVRRPATLPLFYPHPYDFLSGLYDPRPPMPKPDMSRDIALLKALLQGKNAAQIEDIARSEEGPVCRALHFAVRQGKFDIAQLLLQFELNLAYGSPESEILEIAADSEDPAAVTFIQKTLDLIERKNIRQMSMPSPFDCASEAVARYLIEREMDTTMNKPTLDDYERAIEFRRIFSELDCSEDIRPREKLYLTLYVDAFKSRGYLPLLGDVSGLIKIMESVGMYEAAAVLKDEQGPAESPGTTAPVILGGGYAPVPAQAPIVDDQEDYLGLRGFGL